LNRLGGKHAIVTGAGRGIGAAIAKRFAAEGANVSVADINPATAKETADGILGQGGKAQWIQMDVTDSESISRGIAPAKETFGAIDILVNNAGVLTIADSSLDAIFKLSESDWDKVIATNLKGTFLCSQAVVPQMLERKTGAVLNLASVAARTGGTRGWVSYPASKAGVIGLTIDLAKKLAPYGVRVNAIAPGYIITELTRPYTPAERELFAQSCPMRRGGAPEEIAYAALFLCSDESSYITGQVLNVDGGAVTY
jgi:3-oxoacyl-[acyl-carrier protein] reductase